jgi:hypothetical protein
VAIFLPALKWWLTSITAIPSQGNENIRRTLRYVFEPSLRTYSKMDFKWPPATPGWGLPYKKTNKSQNKNRNVIRFSKEDNKIETSTTSMRERRRQLLKKGAIVTALHVAGPTRTGGELDEGNKGTGS